MTSKDLAILKLCTRELRRTLDSKMKPSEADEVVETIMWIIEDLIRR